MRIPTVHRNGTSKQELEDQIREAHLQVSIAIQVLGEAYPNARDYYVQQNYAQGGHIQENKAIQEAINEHADRIKRLVSVQKELMQYGKASLIKKKIAKRGRTMTTEQAKEIINKGREVLDRCVEQRRQLLDTINSLAGLLATLKHYPGDYGLIESGERLCRETMDAYKYKRKEVQI